MTKKKARKYKMNMSKEINTMKPREIRNKRNSFITKNKATR